MASATVSMVGQIIGNEGTVAFVRATLAGGRTAHAYLLTGPARVGKRTLARTFAAGLVCASGSPASTMPTLDLGETERREAPPCGHCRSCTLVATGAHPDVRLIEPEGSRRGILIEQVRQLEHAANLKPYEAQRKVFILTEVESMTDAAANALLKTLEEPPEDTVLLLTASDPTQVLPTIASRCQEVTLRPVPAGTIEAALTARGADPERARLLARLAAGRPGWALAALEDEAQLAARTERVEQLEQLLAQPPVGRLPAAGEFADAAAAREALEVWLGWWRDALLVRHECLDLVANVDRLAALQALAPPPEVCWSAVRRVQETRRQIDANANVRLALEALLLDLPLSGAGDSHALH